MTAFVYLLAAWLLVLYLMGKGERMTSGAIRDTEATTYRGYRMRVESDRIIVFGGAGTRAEFASMATARLFIRSLTKDNA